MTLQYLFPDGFFADWPHFSVTGQYLLDIDTIVDQSSNRLDLQELSLLSGQTSEADKLATV